MKIAYFTDSYLPQINGVTFSVASNAELIAQKGHQIHIFAPEYGKNDDINQTDNIKIYRYKSFTFPLYKDAKVCVPNIYSIYKNLKEFKPDIIHFHTPAPLGVTAILMARMFKTPLIGTYHTLISETTGYLNPFLKYKKSNRSYIFRTSFVKKMTWKLINFFYSPCNVVISPTQTVAEEIRKSLKNEVVVISNGIDLELFTPKNYSKDPYKLLFVGRLGYEKNIDSLIYVLNKINKINPKITLTIVGHGPMYNNLKNLAELLGLKENVHFTGKIDRTDLPNIYKEHDIFVTAATMETEGLTVLEAMSSGMPIIGVKKYGLIDLIKDEVNGYIIEPNDLDAFADKILNLTKHHEKIKEMGQNSINIAKKSDSKINVDNFLQLYKDYMHQNRQN